MVPPDPAVAVGGGGPGSGPVADGGRAPLARRPAPVSGAAAALRPEAGLLEASFLVARPLPSAGEFEHAPQRALRPLPDRVVEGDLVLSVIQAPRQLGQRVHLDVPAARRAGEGDGLLLRVRRLEPIDQAALGPY